MPKRYIPKQLRPGPTARPRDSSGSSTLSTEEQLFKAVYIMERRILHQFRNGEESSYCPSGKYDGKPCQSSSVFNLEVKARSKNTWKEKYEKIAAKSGMGPVRYLRILFGVIRNSALSPPTVDQLDSANNVKLVLSSVPEVSDISGEFKSSLQRLFVDVVLEQKGSGRSKEDALYYVLVGSGHSCSDLFKYCLAKRTAEQFRQSGEDCELLRKFEKLAERHQFLAAMEFTTHPELIQQVWDKFIPSNFSVAAKKILSDAVADIGVF